jgi:ABC-type glycerol-3-phosphate transport system substrate-binding protein
LNVQRLNTIYYRASAVQETGLDLPSSLEELPTFAQALVERGYEHPLCIGSMDEWPAEQLLFDAILPAVTGGDYHARLWSGEESARDPEVREAVQLLSELWPYFNDDPEFLSWGEGIDRLFDPSGSDCVMTVTGNAAKGHFKELGLEPDQDFLERPFPGTEGVYVMQSEVLAIPSGVPNRDSALRVARVAMELDVQVEMAKIRGLHPARVDFNVQDFDESTRQVMEQFFAAVLVPSFRGLVPAGSFDRLGYRLRYESWDEGAVDELIDYLDTEYENAFPR